MKKFFSALALITLLVFAWSNTPLESDAAPDWQSYSPPAWILGPLQGADGKERAILDNLDAIAKWDIPITAFHFDAPDWQSCTGNGDFKYSSAILQRMRQQKIRGLFWTVPLIGLNCPEYQVALANNYFVKDDEGNVVVTDNFTGHGSWIDYDNPDAVAYYHSLLDRIRARAGDVLGGFYTDSVRPDKYINDALEYGEAYALDLLNYTRTHIPDGDVVFKRYGKNTPSDTWLEQNAHVAYVNDLPTTFNGMKIGIQRVFDTASLMSLPYNEFSGFNATPPDAETYIRRMHWGAFQPVMENVPKTAQPWDARYPAQVMQVYRYYANLHRELAPYLFSYDRAAYETHTPILRDMNTATFSARLGDEFFVKYVTDYRTKVSVTLPPGEWLNYWDETKLYNGGTTINYPVPLGREPIFILRGAIIPMFVNNNITGHGTTASRKLLTVNVYPTDHSTFRYFDDENGWLTLDVSSLKQRLALCTLEQIPSRALLYRIARVRNKPNFVKAQDGAISVNGQWGAPLPEYTSEEDAARANKGWYYDAAAKRLIVKLTARGTNCPAP